MESMLNFSLFSQLYKDVHINYLDTISKIGNLNDLHQKSYHEGKSNTIKNSDIDSENYQSEEEKNWWEENKVSCAITNETMKSLNSLEIKFK